MSGKAWYFGILDKQMAALPTELSLLLWIPPAQMIFVQNVSQGDHLLL